MSLIGNISSLSKCPKCGTLQSTNDGFCQECGSIIESELTSDESSLHSDDLEIQNDTVQDDIEPDNGLVSTTDQQDGSKEAVNSPEESPRTKFSPAPVDSLVPPTYGLDALAIAVEMDEPPPLESDSPSYIEQQQTPPDLEEPEGETSDEEAETTQDESEQEVETDSLSDNVPPPRNGEPSESGVVIRPPVLASEALREDVAPREPGRNTIRILLILIGITGSIVTLQLIGISGIGTALCCAFLALTALSIPPIPYAARAAAVLIISASTLGVVTWMHVVRVGTPMAIVETINISVLASALLFRAWHRASILARMMVALGIALCVSWLGMSGILNEITTLDPAWQTWLPTILRIPLGLILILSLLAFMDGRSTGGCRAWAITLLFWYGLDMSVQFITYCWPQGTSEPLWPQTGSQAATIAIAMLISPLLTVLVVYGVAQLLAIAVSVETRG